MQLRFTKIFHIKNGDDLPNHPSGSIQTEANAAVPKPRPSLDMLDKLEFPHWLKKTHPSSVQVDQPIFYKISNLSSSAI